MTPDEIADTVQTILVEEGSVCEHTNDDGPTLIVDVWEVSAIISRELENRGLTS